LQQQGYTVLGIELSEVAVQAFFSENGYAPKISGSEKLKSYETSDLRILCGDFFDLSRDDLAKITAVYDRAAMVALPPEMRKNYVSHLVSILPAATQIMLITFDYPQSEMSGPPFALAADEVEALYGMYADIRLLAQVDVLAQNPRFQKRGLTRLQESIYLLTLR
jgi:thiopurine S-methyltransferase